MARAPRKKRIAPKDKKILELENRVKELQNDNTFIIRQRDEARKEAAANLEQKNIHDNRAMGLGSLGRTAYHTANRLPVDENNPVIMARVLGRVEGMLNQMAGDGDMRLHTKADAELYKQERRARHCGNGDGINFDLSKSLRG